MALDLLPELTGDADPEAKDEEDPVMVVADAAYGTGAARAALEGAGADLVVKAPPEGNSHGGFPKSAFCLDLEAGTATCPAGVTTTRLVHRREGGGWFAFPGEVCGACPLRAACTSSKEGRMVTFGPHEELLARARAFQGTEEFGETYRSKRPTVERVVYRLTRRGGRKARYRGRTKVEAQEVLKAAGENLARMLRLRLTWGEEGWVIG